MVDLTRHGSNSSKKEVSASSATLNVSDFSGTNALDVFLLPESALVTEVFVIPVVAGNTGVRLKVDLGTTVAVAAANVGTAGTVTRATPNLMTGSGMKVSVTPSAAVTAGSFVVVVSYVEYTVSTGNQTDYLVE